MIREGMRSEMLNYAIISIVISIIIYLANVVVTCSFSKFNFERMKKNFGTQAIGLLIPFINVIMSIGDFYLFAIDSIKNKDLTYDEAKEEFNKKIDMINIRQEELKKEREKIDAIQLGSCSGTYLGGHEELAETGRGKIELTKEHLQFKINESFKTGEFKLPLRQIKNMAYDTEKNLTLARAIMFGVFALGMQKNNYYLVVDYTNDYDVSNQIVFDLGYAKNQDFYNKLNIQRNKCIKEYMDNSKSSIPM